MTDEALRAAERAWRARPGDPALRDAVVAARRRAGVSVPPGLLVSLPRHAPHLVWDRAECLPCDFGWAQRPVVCTRGGDAVVLLAGGEDRTGDPVGLLQGLALRDGRELLRLQAELPSTVGGTEVSPPAALADGTLAVVVYEHGVRTRVLHLDPAGRLLDAQELEGTQGYDLGIKLFLGPVTPLDGQDHLVTWLYRQVREYRTERRRPGRAAPVWSSPELLVGAGREVVVGLTPPEGRGATDPLAPDGATLVGRDARTGVERWRRPASHTLAAGQLLAPDPCLDDRELLLVVDRGPRVASKQAANAAGEAQLEESAMTAALESLWDALPPEPARLVALDPTTGTEVWAHGARTEGPAEIVGLAVAPTGVTLHVRGPDGQRVVHLSRDGQPLGESRLPGPGLGAWGLGAEQERPTLVARDVDAVLLAVPDRLECLGLDGSPRWSLPHPGTSDAHHPRRGDRLLGLEGVVVHEGRLVRRSGRWVGVYA